MKNVIKMKSKYLILLAAAVIILSVYCCNEDRYDMNRPQAPTNLLASKGDTSVFLNWDKTNTPYGYVIVRGLNVIDSVLVNSYIDDFAPDTMVEYRVYSVNELGWRSYHYAADSGYMGIPSGILPRLPVSFSATTNNYEGSILTWLDGRFVQFFRIYRDDELIADSVKTNTFVDSKAPVNEVEYKMFAVNLNGSSPTHISAKGQKAYYFMDTFEDLADGTIIEPWTFRASNIGYYTEGNPYVTVEEAYDGSKSLKVDGGKVQILCDWGGVPKDGFYKISVMIKKETGGIQMRPSFTSSENIAANSEWTHYEVMTGLLSAGNTINLHIEPDGTGPAYVDNLSIEYIAPEPEGLEQ